MSSHHYLYHRQNMDPMYPSSRSREPVGEVKIMPSSVTLCRNNRKEFFVFLIYFKNGSNNVKERLNEATAGDHRLPETDQSKSTSYQALITFSSLHSKLVFGKK